MTPHAHLAAGDPSLVAAAAAAIAARGEKWTPLREAVFATLADAAGPVSAYDVTDAVSRREGRRIAANSVYRILDLFVAHGVAKRVESANAYVANTHPACAHDCIFLVCDACGATGHIDDDALAGALRARAAATGFSPRRPVLEVRGLCAACADPPALPGADEGRMRGAS